MQRAIRHKQAKLIKFVLLCSIYYYYYCHAIFRFLKKYSIYLLIIIIIMQFLGFLRNFQFTQFFINMNILKEKKNTTTILNFNITCNVLNQSSNLYGNSGWQCHSEL